MEGHYKEKKVKRLSIPSALLDANSFIRLTACGFWKTQHQLEEGAKCGNSMFYRKSYKPFLLKGNHLLMKAIHHHLQNL